MIKNILLSVVVIFLTIITQSKGLATDGANEQKCFNISKTVPLDLNWVATIKTLYYPVMSRLELYEIASDLLQTNTKSITEAELYYDSCIVWNMYTNGTIISRGFNGLSREYKTELLSPALQKFRFMPTVGKGYSGTVYTTLTDNETFLFTPFCTDNGEMAWGLGSIYPTLPKETIKLALRHAESLGFKKEFFTQLRYNMCDFSDAMDNEDEVGTTEVTADVDIGTTEATFDVEIGTTEISNSYDV